MGNILTYHRRKTGRQITITVTKDAMNIIREYMDTTTESPYLFPILSCRGRRGYHLSGSISRHCASSIIN